MNRAVIVLCGTMALLHSSYTLAQTAQTPASAPPAIQGTFDPEAATEAWLARQTPDQREKSDAYFEGGYWLDLLDFLYGLAIAALLLSLGLSARMRGVAERAIRFRPLQVFLYWLQYLVLGTILAFPLTLDRGFFREHAYGLSNQSFGEWMIDLLKGLGVGAILGGLAMVGIYAIFRRFPRTWWIWGTASALVFLVLLVLIAPVFIAPLFNKYTELDDPELRDPILSLARANGIPAEHVYVFDASKQTKRVSANVSGVLGTMRISLNDNLLNRVSPGGVKAVMGHEMGHYVLNHVYEGILWGALVLLVGFGFLRWGFQWALARWGGRWGVRAIDDPAGLPLLSAVFSIFFFVLTPLNNTYIRVNEAEADMFGLNAAREPDGFAETALLLGEYRKLRPGPVEEWIFFDHPSGYSRILMAMRWKAENERFSP